MCMSLIVCTLLCESDICQCFCLSLGLSLPLILTPSLPFSSLHLAPGIITQVETLAAMTPIVNGCDVIRLAARHLLFSHVKSQPCVREIFFPGHVAVDAETKIDPNWFDFDTFACLVVCQTLCEAEDPFGISRTLRRGAIHNALEEIYASPQWRRMGKS